MVPPFVPVAVKVTGELAQVGLVPEEIATATVGATVALTVTVILFEVAVVGFAHAEFEVNMQLITSPLTGEDKV